MPISMTWQDLISPRMRTPLVLLASLMLGAAGGYVYIQADAATLVVPRAPGQALVQQVTAKLSPSDLQEDADTLRTTPVWQLMPDGRDFVPPKSAADAPPPPPERWTLVGRAKRPDGVGLVLYQAETQVTKFFKVNERLPDGRKLLRIEETAFVLGPAQGRKRERIEYGAGLTVDAPAPAPADAAPVKP